MADKKQSASTKVKNLAPQPAGESPPEYEVEKITGKRFFNGRPQVRVKWLGYPDEESTWEPQENLGHCIGLLTDFEAEMFARSQLREPSSSESSDSEQEESTQTKASKTVMSIHTPLSAFSHTTSDSNSSSSSSDVPLPSLGERNFGQLEISPIDTSQSSTSTTSSVQSTSSGSPEWLMSLPDNNHPVGLERGLKLDKVVHHFQIDKDYCFLFVKWIGCTVTDAVLLDEIMDKYPDQIIAYFEGLKRIWK